MKIYFSLLQLQNNRKEKFVEELKKCVKEAEVQDKVIELENTIAELEEEKGNLQLRLVDFEEMTGSTNKYM